MPRVVLLQRDGVVDLIGPYLPDLVDDLKSEIPSHGRRWNPEFKCWTVGDRWLHVARRLAEEHAGMVVEAFGRDELERRVRAEVERRSFGDADDDAETLGVSPRAPREVVQAAYRALARLHHPDLVGPASTAAMQKINAAFERVSSRARA